jgi:L-ascorbate metabolism protein UlaG (beta-lactamase superfamily)
MSPIHISPEEAVRIHLELDARKSIAIHFGTFPLGDDGMWQPVTDLENAKNEYKVNNFHVLEPGGFISLE